MMEEAEARERHRDAVLVTSCDDLAVLHTAARLHNVLDTVLGRLNR